MSRKRLLVIAPLAIAGMFAFVAIGGFVVQLLWNWLLPPLFGWREITFWQGVGLLALCRILFGGFRMHGAAHHGSVRRSMVDRLADRIGERFDAMSPEERERFRERLRERCGMGPSTSAPNPPQ
jgi:hypothetical protein